MSGFKLQKIIKGSIVEYSQSFLTKNEAELYAKKYVKLGLGTEIIQTTSKSVDSKKGCILYDLYYQIK